MSNYYESFRTTWEPGDFSQLSVGSGSGGSAEFLVLEITP